MKDYIFRLQLGILTWFFVAVFVVTMSFLWFAFELKDVFIFISGVMVWISTLMSTIYLMFFYENDFHVFDILYEQHDWQ